MRLAFRSSATLLAVLAVAGCNAMTGIDDYTVTSNDGGGGDGPRYDGGNNTCPQSCLDTAKTCGDACTATETTCSTACTNPGCKNQCKSDGDNCRKACSSTCSQCGKCYSPSCNSAAGVN